MRRSALASVVDGLTTATPSPILILMTTNLRDLALEPRAIAVLVALRSGPLTLQAVSTRISDRQNDETEVLIRDMIDLRLVAWVGSVSLHLDHDGLGWLQSKGLDASPGAVQALYAATDAQAVRS
jgi:hypothetical protein